VSLVVVEEEDEGDDGVVVLASMTGVLAEVLCVWEGVTVLVGAGGGMPNDIMVASLLSLGFELFVPDDSTVGERIGDVTVTATLVVRSSLLVLVFETGMFALFVIASSSSLVI
jgi:hypothetical protein